MVPLGYAALTCGVHIRDGKFLLQKHAKGVTHTPEEHTVFLVHCPFDIGADEHHPPETRLAAGAALASAWARIPGSMRDKVGTWREAMEKHGRSKNQRV